MKNRPGKYVLTIIALMLCLSGCSLKNSPKETPFDYYTDCTTKQQIEELAEEPFVESIFSFTLIICQRPGYSSSMEGQIAYLLVPSFDDLDTSPFNRSCLIKKDAGILQSADMHPVIISESLAKAENLSLGDKLYQNTRISDEALEFTVAAIYRHSPLFAQFDAVALINEQITEVFDGILDEQGYTNAYIKASDKELLKIYFEEEFVPGLEIKGLSEEQIAAIPREDLKAYYEDYETHMKRMK